MDATLDGSEASVMRRVIRTARRRPATETTDLVLLGVLTDTGPMCMQGKDIYDAVFVY